MTCENLVELRNSFKRLFNAGNYIDAVEMLRTELKFFPNNTAEIKYYIAQTEVSMGNHTAAITELRHALGAGHYFNEKILHQTSLNPLRGNRDFENVVKYSEFEYQKIAASQKMIIEPFSPQHSPRPWPLLIAIHENKSSIALEHSLWSSAQQFGWMLLMPQSQYLGPTTRSYVWKDEEQFYSELEEATSNLVQKGMVDPSKIVFAGFGEGAWMAMRATFRLKKHKPRGFIWIEGVINEPICDRIATLFRNVSGPLPDGYFICGEKAAYRCMTMKVYEQLTSRHIDCRLEKTKNGHHCFPSDFPNKLRHALDYILGMKSKEAAMVEDKRRLERKMLGMFSRVYDRKDGKLIGNLNDLTIKGAMIFGGQFLIPGTITQVRLEIPEDFEMEGIYHIDLLAKVIYCKPDLNPVNHITGMEFLQLTDKDIYILEKIVKQYEFRREAPHYPPTATALDDNLF